MEGRISLDREKKKKKKKKSCGFLLTWKGRGLSRRRGRRDCRGVQAGKDGGCRLGRPEGGSGGRWRHLQRLLHAAAAAAAAHAAAAAAVRAGRVWTSVAAAAAVGNGRGAAAAATVCLGLGWRGRRRMMMGT